MEINYNRMKNIIEYIVPGSIADDLSIEAGDLLISVNNKEPLDIIDYKYLINDEFIELEIEKNNQRYIYEIEKEAYDDLGIEFTNPLIDKAKNCTNKCVFCFIDQLPKGMRKSLYFKDDDSRLSFLQGNFITLTNLKEEEIERIIKYHISPVNISIHTTNPKLRCKMLNNRFAGKSFEILKRFASANISMNCQIVCIPDMNDGKELDKTIIDLYSLFPSIESVAIVPVGITKFREGLYPLKTFDKENAEKIINQITDYQKRFLQKGGSRFVYLADEFYILANRDIPESFEYENYPQLENGVGLIRNFYDEFKSAKLNYKPTDKKRRLTLATGTLAFDFIKQIVNEASELFPNYELNVKAIINEFFGETITVAGLITGVDIINQLKDDISDAIILPSCMFRDGTEVMLDDHTRTDLENILRKPIIITDNTGEDFIRKLYGEVNYG
ncbi:MAG: DUF512 domain-containing protein [Tissierellia bacterium]|nr:DUF512 domain-containing protein [Tissierellia bacterium]